MSFPNSLGGNETLRVMRDRVLGRDGCWRFGICLASAVLSLAALAGAGVLWDYDPTVGEAAFIFWRWLLTGFPLSYAFAQLLLLSVAVLRGEFLLWIGLAGGFGVFGFLSILAG